jgi:hypothetical protein
MSLCNHCSSIHAKPRVYACDLSHQEAARQIFGNLPMSPHRSGKCHRIRIWSPPMAHIARTFCHREQGDETTLEGREDGDLLSFR